MTTSPGYSISVRLRRTVHEEAFVSVPVTAEVMRPEPDEDGRYRLDTEKLFAEAVRMGIEGGDWQVEATEVEVHPIQMAPPGVFPQ
jgi:hypothetical protein